MKLLFLIFKTKALFSLLTMLGTIWVYAMFYGWKFAAGFVGLIFIHEMGHYLAAKQMKLDVGLPTFIPFIGAYINVKDMSHDSETEAYIAYAGPFIGSLAAFACYFYARSSGEDMYMALAYSGFFLNLFNLIPISPLDGGRITQVLSPRIWFIGVPFLLALFFYSPSPLLLLIGVMALPSLKMAWYYDPKDLKYASHANVKFQTRFEYAILYLGLAAVLAIMAYNVHGTLRLR